MNEPSGAILDHVAARDLFRVLFDESPDGLVLVDSAGHIVLSNRHIEQMLGYSDGEINGKPVEVLVSEEKQELVLELRRAIVDITRSRSAGFVLDVIGRTANGSTFPVEVSLARCDLASTPMVIATMRDVAESRHVAEQQRQIISTHSVGDVVSSDHSFTTVASLGLGLAGIAEAVHLVTGGIVLVEDYEGTLSFCSGAPDMGVVGIPGWRHIGGLRHAKVFRDDDWLVAVARPGGKTLGAVSLFDPDGEAGEGASFALEQAATVLAMELFRLRSEAESELKLWGDLASELLDDPDVERSRRRAIVLGYKLDRPHRAVLIRWDELKTRQVFPVIRSAARKVGLDATLLTLRPSGVVLLVADEADWKEFSSVLSSEMGSLCRIGIGFVHDLSTLRRSLAEAELALSLGSANVVRIDQLGVLGLLAVDADPARLRAMVERWIGKLIAHDADHGSELVLTLAKFLRNQGAIESTARELYVHSSTLKYRLRRIREICDRDLRDPDDRFNLELACRVFAILEDLSAANSMNVKGQVNAELERVDIARDYLRG